MPPDPTPPPPEALSEEQIEATAEALSHFRPYSIVMSCCRSEAEHHVHEAHRILTAARAVDPVHLERDELRAKVEQLREAAMIALEAFAQSDDGVRYDPALWGAMEPLRHAAAAHPQGEEGG